MRALLFVLAAAASTALTPGCGSQRAARDTGPGDAGNSDAAGEPSDAATSDMGARDGSVADAGRDGSLADAGRDAGARDVGTDAPRDAAAVDGGALGRLIQCAPPVPAGPGSGIVFSSNIWSGFRFELTSATHVTRIGLQIAPDSAGSIFGAIVRLSGSSDTPDDPALGGADVVMRTLFSVPASPSAPVIGAGALDVMLPAGWYAVVFGSGAFGATATGTVPSGGGTGCVSSPGSSYPFSIRQSDGMFILQGAEPHFFVEVTP